MFPSLSTARSAVDDTFGNEPLSRNGQSTLLNTRRSGISPPILNSDSRVAITKLIDEMHIRVFFIGKWK